MAKIANECDRGAKQGFCNMSKKWNNLGVPRNMMGGKTSPTTKADKRGMSGDVCMK